MAYFSARAGTRQPTMARVGELMANPVGRPSKYNDEMQEQADRYLYSLEDLGHAIPSRAGLCCFLGISKSTSQLWEQEYPEFSATLSNVEVLQEHMALNGGITNKMNSTIVKLVLANHGYSDRQALDHTTGGQPMQSTQDAVLRALEAKHQV